MENIDNMDHPVKEVSISDDPVAFLAALGVEAELVAVLEPVIAPAA